ncbi:MAG: PSD1 and planctomycete cytochrome C domain-containing protein [Planctomycetota bacterium]
MPPVFAAETDQPSAGEKLFALTIKPLLSERCLACHGADPDDLQGGLDLRSRESLLRGGDSFESDVVHDGDGESSLLYLTVARKEVGYEMPPKEADALTETQAWAFRDWINEGAPWPSDKRVREIQTQYAAGEQVTTSKALSDDWQNRRYEPQKLWAYRPRQDVSVPEGVHLVDWFIDRRLDDLGLSPASSASATEFVRRLSFGLTGLPPAPASVLAFESEYAENPDRAVEQLASELMSQPHYGEHFGLHWLDVVRYADTAGFANDYSRPNAWRYRDYVIRSFNDDKPYRQFVLEQLAGDELDEKSPEHLVATGFLRMGPWEQTSMSVFKETRQQWLDDVTDSVGQTFLAHAMQCAKCHDHKFDPVPTRDYYGMMAVFSTTQFAEPNADFLPSEDRTGFQDSKRWVEQKIAAYKEQETALNRHMKRQRKQETGDAKVGENGLDPGDEASLARIRKNIARHRWELDRVRPIALAVYTGSTIARKNVGNRLQKPKDVWEAGEIEPDTILTGGSVYSPSEPVTPGALSAAVSLGEMAPDAFPAGQGKRRLAFANWVVDPANPLTARVIVNRVWSWHFGKGIAGNPNNFGGTGALPTHPELLDALANWFIDHGWSIKKLNHLIVTSEAYRRSTRHPDPEGVEQRDPAREGYATFPSRRLTAEELRDAMLTVSGELNRQVGGIPCRPDINLEVAFQPRQIMGGAASVYEPDPKPKQRNRRSVYTEKIRGLRDPFFESFNQPGPDKSCELRETSTVAPQALTLMNSEEVLDRATAFAARLLHESAGNVNTAEERQRLIQRAFRLSLGRAPSDEEVAICHQHWETTLRSERDRKYSSDSPSNKISRTVMAEKTGQPYTFEEHLPAYIEYESDLQFADVDAETRALAHVCLVLFNSNEFSYLD